jgi:hypothetical protein
MYFEGRASDSKVDELSKMINNEYNIETSTNNDFSTNTYFVDLKETKYILNDLLHYFNQPRKRDETFSLIVMHFSTDIRNELARLKESI